MESHFPETLNFSFKEFLHSLEEMRSALTEKKHLDFIPDTVAQVHSFLKKRENIQDWISKSQKEPITWEDYSFSWFTRKNLQVDKSNSPTLQFCTSICFFYYQSHHLYLEEASFEDFISHKLYDYTRPHCWFNYPDYVSIGEAIFALTKLRETHYYEYLRVLESWQSQYSEYFPKIPQEYLDFIIPYEFYSKCFDDAHDFKTIKPFSIEICFFYVRQHGLSQIYIWEEKATQERGIDNVCHHIEYFLPSLKFIGILDVQILICAWDIYRSYYPYDPEGYEAFEKYSSSYYNIVKPKEKNKLFVMTIVIGGALKKRILI